MIKHAKGGDKADVYAFGILLWELATREEVRLPPAVGGRCAFGCAPIPSSSVLSLSRSRGAELEAGFGHGSRAKAFSEEDSVA